jgi:hypothetical protein
VRFTRVASSEPGVAGLRRVQTNTATSSDVEVLLGSRTARARSAFPISRRQKRVPEPEMTHVNRLETDGAGSGGFLGNVCIAAGTNVYVRSCVGERGVC